MLTDNNVDLIVDLWSRLKSHVPVKERLEVADLIVNVFNDHGMADGLEEEEGLDKELKAAVKSYYSDDDEDDEEDDDPY